MARLSEIELIQYARLEYILLVLFGPVKSWKFPGLKVVSAVDSWAYYARSGDKSQASQTYINQIRKKNI